MRTPAVYRGPRVAYSRAMSSMPRFVVLGGPVPARLREGLVGNLELHDESALDVERADGVILHAHGDVLPALRKFRAAGGSLPIFGYAAHSVDIEARLQWIRDGADDLLGEDTAVASLLRRLRGRDRPEVPDAEKGLRFDRYLRALKRYLVVREELAEALGDGGRARYIDVAFQRDQVMRTSDSDATPDAFGQRRGSDRDPLNWPAQVIEPRLGACEIVNIGADGLCLGLSRAPSAGEILRLKLEGIAVSGVIDLEVRWQRRVSKERWEVGALATACRLTRGG